MAIIKITLSPFTALLMVGSMLSSEVIASEGAIDVIAPFPNATIDLMLDELVTSYPVTSSAMKKVNGVVAADSQKWYDGFLSRRIYRLPSGTSSDQAYRFFTGQFELLGVRELFHCDRFSCGDSSFWANDVFNVATLYGLDKEQSYFIGKVEEPSEDVYYLTYTIRRGNKREYALVDVFTTKKEQVSSAIDAGADSETETDKTETNTAHLVAFDELPRHASGFQTSPLTQAIGTMDTFANWLITIKSAKADSLLDADYKTRMLEQTSTALSTYLSNKGFDKARLRIQYLISQDENASISLVPLNR